MFLIENGTIAVTRGDSCAFRYTPTRAAEGKAVFSVKTIFARDAVIQKVLEQGEDGALTIVLTPEDTDIPSGAYVYDVRYQSGDDVDTPDEPGVFLILDAVTKLEEVGWLVDADD